MLMVKASSSCSKWLSVATLCAGAFVLSGCRMYQNWNVSRFDREISRDGKAIASASNDAQRSAFYADRADAYAEKSRYSRIMKLIPDEEYNQLFDFALRDYAQAITLAPDNVELFYRRGNAYYFRASLDMIYAPTSVWLNPAKADFARVVENNPKNIMALDMLGLTEASMGDWTQAIVDFGKEVALNPNYRFRLSDAYCNRGASYAGKRNDLAVADLNHAIEIRTTSDPCECEPFNPLLAIYLNQTHEYDKAREVVEFAQRSRKWIAPEYLEQLKSLSAKH